jgi:hypothetical protein
MAGLVPAIHVLASKKKDVVPGSSPGMTDEKIAAFVSELAP